MRRWLSVVAVALLLVGVPAGLAVGIHLIVADRANERLARPPQPLLLPAVEESYSGSLEATVKPTWQPPTPIVVQQMRPGIVTAVSMVAGEFVESGSQVYEVNGEPVVALHTIKPFYRSLHRGDKGPDVMALEKELATLGFFAGASDETYDRDTDAAVGAWLSHVGRAPLTPGLDVTSVIWLPDESFPVASIHVSVGQPAPGPGQTIAETPPHLGSAVITASGPPLIRGVDFLLQTGLGKASFVWPTDAGGHDLTVTGADAEAIADILPVDGQDVPARIQLAKPLQHVVVPASAIVIGPSGNACLWVRTGEGGLSRRTVKPDSAGFGGAAIQDGVKSGEDVLANPLSTGVAPTCP